MSAVFLHKPNEVGERLLRKRRSIAQKAFLLYDFVKRPTPKETP